MMLRIGTIVLDVIIPNGVNRCAAPANSRDPLRLNSFRVLSQRTRFLGFSDRLVLRPLEAAGQTVYTDGTNYAGGLSSPESNRARVVALRQEPLVSTGG